jgi:glucose-6-phosphate-specific signal transduction histidine kinase
MQLTPITPDSEERAGRSSFGTWSTVNVTVVLALVLVLLPLLNKDVSDVPLLAFMVAVALCAVRFGARGGLGSAIVGALLAILWYVHNQHYASGLAEMLMHIAVFALVGGLVGTVVDRKRDLEQGYRTDLEAAVRERTAQLEQRSRALESAELETLRRLALAAEFRDDATFEHTERVGRAAYLLGAALGLPEEGAAVLRLAAPLHDVGKLGVSDRILLKPG